MCILYVYVRRWLPSLTLLQPIATPVLPSFLPSHPGVRASGSVCVTMAMLLARNAVR
eukprot:COSAG02_NODE_17945_length_969_cov_18.518391_1_plen_56_part_10